MFKHYALVQCFERLKLFVFLSRHRVDQSVRTSLARLHVLEHDVTDPDFSPRVFVECGAIGNDEVRTEAVDVDRLTTTLREVVDASG